MSFPEDLRFRASPPLPAAPPLPPVEPKPDENVHEVLPNDTLAKIGLDYGVDPKAIAERNQLADGNQIQPGSYLIIPKPEPDASGKPPPARLSPEAQRTETATAKLEQAQTNLAAFGSPTRADRHDPDFKSIRTQLGQDVANKRADLKQAIDAEIKAGYQHEFEARPTGAMFTKDTIDHYGGAIAQRYANDPAMKAEVEGVVKELKVDFEVNDVLGTARALGDPGKSAAYVDKQLPQLSADAQSALKNNSEVGGWKVESGKRDGEAVKKAWDDYQNASPSEQTPKMLAMREALKGLGGHENDPLYAEGLAKGLGGDKVKEIVEGFYDEIRGDNPYITDGNLSYLKEYLGPLSQALGNADRAGTLPSDVHKALIESDPARLALFMRFGDYSDATFGDATRMVIDKWGGTGNPYGKFALEHLMSNSDQHPELMRTLMADGKYGTDVYDATVAAIKTNAKSISDGTVGAYSKETEELTWLVSNYAGTMTPEQLNKAITEYYQAKGPDWEKKVKGMEEQVAQDGLKLLGQIDVLQGAPASRQADANKTIEGILGDQKTQYAVSLALKQHPEYIDTTAGRRLMQNIAYGTKLGEQSLKLGKELANAYVRQNLVNAAQNFDPTVPASRTQALAAIDKLKSPELAKLLGLSESKLAGAADGMKMLLPNAGESAEKVAGRLKEFDKLLTNDDYKPSFDKSLPAGQLMRSAGLMFASVGFLNSFDKAAGDPTLKNDLRLMVDAAGMGQKSSELLIGLGKISDDSMFGRFGSSASGRVFGFLSAGFDAWNAGEAFFGAKPDPVKGVLFATSAAGGTLAAVSGTSFAASLGIGGWAGPVGIGLVVIATVGLSIKDRIDQANKFETPTSEAFLRAGGLNPRAAAELMNQSGEGYSVMPALSAYATIQGYDLNKPADQQKFADWINGMDPGKLAKMRDALHHRLDDSDGDLKSWGAATARADLGPGASKYSDADLIRIGVPMVMGQLALEAGVTPLAKTDNAVVPGAGTGEAI